MKTPRLQSLKILVILICVLSFYKSAIAQEGFVKQAAPNIILILADDLGYGDLGVYGQKIIQTPNLNRMAANGMRFTNFYAGSTVCAPSRSSLLTGQHTGHTAIRGNKEIQPEGQAPMKANVFTIAEVCKQAGYQTAAFGKWGLGFIGSEGDPLNQGFDHFFGYNCQRQSHNFYPAHLWDDNIRIALPNTAKDQQMYAPDLIQKRALEFIRSSHEEPFFLYLAYTLPHAALQVPADTLFEFYKKQLNEQPVKIDTSWNGVGYQPSAYPKAAYATMVSRLDAYVGELFDALKASGVDSNTLVIFTSDNGPHQEGGNDPYFFNSNGGLRGIKRDLYEGGVRVPMIARWPGKISAGSLSDHIGAGWDFFPTIVSLIGRSESPNDGISFLPELLHQTGQKTHPFLYWEFHEGGGKQAIRMGKWKGVRLNVRNNSKSPIELYDLQKDPGEKRNLAKNHPDIIRKVDEGMKESHVPNEEFPFLQKSNQ